MITIFHHRANPVTPLTVDEANCELASRQYIRVAKVIGNSLLVAQQRSNYDGWAAKMRVRLEGGPTAPAHLVRPTVPGDILERDGEMFLITKGGYVSLMTLKQAQYG